MNFLKICFWLRLNLISMSFIQVISSDGVIFNISSTELSCSKLLMRIAGDLFLVTKINLDNIPSEVLGNIHRFMKLSVNPPSERWIKDFLEDCAANLCPLLQASHFLEIDQLTSAISELIASQITECKTVEAVFFIFF